MKRLHTLITLLFFLHVLMSCSNSSEDQSGKDNVSSQTTIEFTHNEQKFVIIPLYEEVLKYTAQIKEDPSLNNKEVYYNKVIIPFYNMASERNLDVKGFYSFFSPTLLEQRLEEDTIDSADSTIYKDLVEGNYNKGIPMWSNYKLGYKITQSFLENNPDISINEWTRLDPKEILRGSNYRDL